MRKKTTLNGLVKLWEIKITDDFSHRLASQNNLKNLSGPVKNVKERGEWNLSQEGDIANALTNLTTNQDCDSLVPVILPIPVVTPNSHRTVDLSIELENPAPKKQVRIVTPDDEVIEVIKTQKNVRGKDKLTSILRKETQDSTKRAATQTSESPKQRPARDRKPPDHYQASM